MESDSEPRGVEIAPEELSAEALPRVLIDRTYYATVNAAVRGKAEKQFHRQ